LNRKQGKARALSRRKRLVGMAYPASWPLVDRINRIPTFIKFLAKNDDVPVFETRDALYDHIAGAIGDVPIDYLEFGVHQGKSIASWSGLNACPESRFIGFDSFEGLPEAWAAHQAGHFSTEGKAPQFDDARIRFVRGWFQDTLDGFLKDFTPRHRLVINNDSDLYSSTLYVLTKIDYLAVSGTVIFFDEFDDVQHEFRAMEDYAAAYRRKFKVMAATDRFRTVALEFL
jgi:O-methyltransferase